MPKVERLGEFMDAKFEDQAKFADFPAEAYDVVCNGYEIGGGSVRIADSNVQEKMFQMLGMEEAELKNYLVSSLKHLDTAYHLMQVLHLV